MWEVKFQHFEISQFTSAHSLILETQLLEKKKFFLII